MCAPGTLLPECLNRFTGFQHHERYRALGRLLVLRVWRIDLFHERPDLLALGALGLPPRRAESLARNLQRHFMTALDIEIPLRVHIGAALRCNDDRLAADVSVDQRSGPRLSALSPNGSQEQRRREGVSADHAQVHDVATRATRSNVSTLGLRQPVEPAALDIG